MATEYPSLQTQLENCRQAYFQANSRASLLQEEIFRLREIIRQQSIDIAALQDEIAALKQDRLPP